jgi:hypothetical protein
MGLLLFAPKGRDGFKVDPNGPLRAEHELLNEYVQQVLDNERWAFFSARLADTEAGKRIAALDAESKARVVLALVERLVPLSPYNQSGDPARHRARDGFERALRSLLMTRLPLTETHLRAVLDWLIAEPPTWRRAGLFPYVAIAKSVEEYSAMATLSDELAERVLTLGRELDGSNGFDRETRKAAKRLTAASGRGPALGLAPGEAWSDAVVAHVRGLAGEAAATWAALLEHCAEASGGKPSGKWSTAAGTLIEGLGKDEVREALLEWFPLVDKPRTAAIATWSRWMPNPNLLIDERNADTLKGLVWCCAVLDDGGLADALARLAVSTYRKVPLIGPRAVKIGNACVHVLGEMHSDAALAALALLKVRVKFGTAQKGINKALDAAAARAGLTRDELEEIGVPAYGLDPVGLRREAFAEGQAELSVGAASKTALEWVNAEGKRQKTIPKSVSQEHAEDLKELKSAAKDIEKMLVAQSARLEGLFLSRREWRLLDWRERYLDHPLVGTLARRLVWEFNTAGSRVAGCWHAGELVDRAGGPLQSLAADTTVRLWHPALESAEAVVEWRAWFESREIAQPFKQAHREIYLLTDAERATRVYSNRFAAHVLKQHQFNALCAARGWRNQLRLLVDADYAPPTLELPAWNLRAEFWVEGAGNDYGTDTNESGTFLYLTTDQVRFYAHGAAGNRAHASGGGYSVPRAAGTEHVPAALEEIPPLVLSEVLRDVDLFVGVASVGNDPTWADGGAAGRYRDYWNAYSFGELGVSATTRRAFLERLLPRLKIHDRCTISDQFLVVRGNLRTYKIHLGSANILMEPNDQYLCIVPAQSQSQGKSNVVFLPFEGDTRLAVILSKAFLLAADDKIEDPTIVRQIAGHHAAAAPP